MRTKMTLTFITADGKEFADENLAKEHERKLQLEGLQKIAMYSPTLEKLDGDYADAMYIIINTQEELNILREYARKGEQYSIEKDLLQIEDIGIWAYMCIGDYDCWVEIGEEYGHIIDAFNELKPLSKKYQNQ